LFCAIYGFCFLFFLYDGIDRAPFLSVFAFSGG
jgi:hypothetical protein